jgi:hypothetical protein
LQLCENQDSRITIGNQHRTSANNKNLRSKLKLHFFPELAPEGQNLRGYGNTCGYPQNHCLKAPQCHVWRLMTYISNLSRSLFMTWEFLNRSAWAISKLTFKFLIIAYLNIRARDWITNSTNRWIIKLRKCPTSTSLCETITLAYWSPVWIHWCWSGAEKRKTINQKVKSGERPGKKW